MRLRQLDERYLPGAAAWLRVRLDAVEAVAQRGRRALGSWDADALDDQQRYGEIPDGPIGVDLPPDKNPATAAAGDKIPDAVTEPDEKSQEPDESDEERSEQPETPV